MGAYHIETHEKQREAEQKLADALGAALVHEQKHYCKANERQNKSRYIHLEAEERYYPRGKSSTHISAHNDRHGLPEGHEACVDKTYDHHGRCRRTLNQRCYHYAGKKTRESVAGHCRQYIAEPVAGRLLQAFTHHLHAVEEQSHGTEQTQEI